jgi:hypothetical protein
VVPFPAPAVPFPAPLLPLPAPPTPPLPARPVEVVCVASVLEHAPSASSMMIAPQVSVRFAPVRRKVMAIPDSAFFIPSYSSIVAAK